MSSIVYCILAAIIAINAGIWIFILKKYGKKKVYDDFY